MYCKAWKNHYTKIYHTFPQDYATSQESPTVILIQLADSLSIEYKDKLW